MINIQEYLLTCLSEECAEVIHRICKALRFGLDDVQEGLIKSNKERLQDEIIDFIAILELLHEKDILSSSVIDFSLNPDLLFKIVEKKKKVHKYMKYSTEKCHTLEVIQSVK